MYSVNLEAKVFTLCYKSECEYGCMRKTHGFLSTDMYLIEACILIQGDDLSVSSRTMM